VSSAPTCLLVFWSCLRVHRFTSNSFIAIILAFAGVCLLSTFPGWREEEEEDSEGSTREIRPFPSRPLTYSVLFAASFSGLFGFTSAFWQHLSTAATVSMAKTLTYGVVIGHVGAAAMVLGWLAAALCVAAALLSLAMILSIKVLGELAG
jgi:hypothetical protein